MRLTVIQNRPIVGETAGNIDTVEQMLEGVETDMIVLPELFASGYYFHSSHQVQALAESVPNGATTNRLVALAKRVNAIICAGLPERDGNKIYNSAVLVGPEGFIAVYRKIHLFFEESLWFTPGDIKLQVHDLPIGRVGMMICFDWRFPEVARSLALQGAQILLHPANLVHRPCQDAMITRCIENNVYAATANRIGTDTKPNGESLTFTGRSQIVAPDGRVLCSGPENEVWLETVSITPTDAMDKSVTNRNDLFADRRPEYYSTITQHIPGGKLTYEQNR